MSRKIKRYYVCLHTAGPIGQLNLIANDPTGQKSFKLSFKDA